MDLTHLARTYGLESTVRLQDGLITRAQALALGVQAHRIDRQLARRNWVRLLPGVYRCDDLETAPAGSAGRACVRAGWLWAGQDATVALSAAAWWWGLQRNLPAVVDVWVPPRQRLSSQPGYRVRRRQLPPEDVTVLDGICVTTRARTALDLAAAGTSDGLDALARDDRVNLTELDRSLARGSGSRGWIRARAEVAGTTSNPWSAAERLLHADLFAAVIKDWDANVRMWAGGRIRVVDVRFRYVPLIIEVDGREYHGTAEAFEGDRERDAELAALGWTVLRFTWAQLTGRSTWVLNTIRATIARLEGSPMPRDCTPTT